MHEIASDVLVIKIVLEKGGNLTPKLVTLNRMASRTYTNLQRADVDVTVDEIVANFDVWMFS